MIDVPLLSNRRMKSLDVRLLPPHRRSAQGAARAVFASLGARADRVSVEAQREPPTLAAEGCDGVPEPMTTVPKKIPESRVSEEVPRFSRLENLAEEVHSDHRARIDTPLKPDLVPRPFKRRPRPRTAVIAERAREIIEATVWATEWDDEDLEP
jgi:hypothetical protein